MAGGGGGPGTRLLGRVRLGARRKGPALGGGGNRASTSKTTDVRPELNLAGRGPRSCRGPLAGGDAGEGVGVPGLADAWEQPGVRVHLTQATQPEPRPPALGLGGLTAGAQHTSQVGPAPGVCWKHTNEHPNPAPPPTPPCTSAPHDAAARTPQHRPSDRHGPAPLVPGTLSDACPSDGRGPPTCWPPPPEQQENSHFRREGQGRRPRAELRGRPVAVRRRPSCHLSPKGQRTAKQTKRRHARHQPGLQVVSRRRGGRVEALSARPPAGHPGALARRSPPPAQTPRLGPDADSRHWGIASRSRGPPQPAPHSRPVPEPCPPRIPAQGQGRPAPPRPPLPVPTGDAVHAARPALPLGRRARGVFLLARMSPRTGTGMGRERERAVYAVRSVQK